MWVGQHPVMQLAWVRRVLAALGVLLLVRS
jgi:hypothetical protein